MCNQYAESVLHQSETKSQIVEESNIKSCKKKVSTDSYSNYSGRKSKKKISYLIFIFFQSDAFCQTYDQQWQTTIQNGQRNLLLAQTPDQNNRRQTNGNETKKDSQTANRISTDHNVYAKVQLQLDMLDYNYEQDKREYYAQLIRESKKNFPAHELEKELREKVNYWRILWLSIDFSYCVFNTDTNMRLRNHRWIIRLGTVRIIFKYRLRFSNKKHWAIWKKNRWTFWIYFYSLSFIPIHLSIRKLVKENLWDCRWIVNLT